MNLLQRLETSTWQIGAIGAAALSVILGAALLASTFEVRGLERDKAQLEAHISDLQNDLDTCRGNTGRLQNALAEQDAEILLLEDQGRRAIETAEAAVAQARRDNRILERRIAGLLAAPAAGDTVCERLEAVDRAVAEAFQ